MVRLICTLLLLGSLGREVAEEHVCTLPLTSGYPCANAACSGELVLGFTGSRQ